MAAVVVVGTPVARKKQERARRICLERLLHELGRLGVECVWLEERTKSLNSKDHQMVIALRRSRTISSGCASSTPGPSRRRCCSSQMLLPVRFKRLGPATANT